MHNRGEGFPLAIINGHALSLRLATSHSFAELNLSRCEQMWTRPEIRSIFFLRCISNSKTRGERSIQMKTRNPTSHLVAALVASVLLWPSLIVAAWLYMPAPLAAITSAVHLVGMIATAGPLISFLRSNVARTRKRRVSFSFPRLAGSGGSPFFPSRGEARERPDWSLEASRITSLDSGSNHLTTAKGEEVLPLIRARVFSDAEGPPDPLDIPTIWRLTEEDSDAGFDHVAPMPVPLDLSKSDPEEAA